MSSSENQIYDFVCGVRLTYGCYAIVSLSTEIDNCTVEFVKGFSLWLKLTMHVVSIRKKGSDNVGTSSSTMRVTLVKLYIV